MNQNELEAYKKQDFLKGLEALRKSDSNYLGIIHTNANNYAIGKFNSYDKSRIVNAYIRIKNGNNSEVWCIEDGEIKSFPSQMGLWFKNEKKMGLYSQNGDSAESYIFFGNKEFSFPSDCSIWGIAENEDYAFTFYVDDKSDEILYTQEFKEDEKSMLFELMKNVLISKKEEVDLHERCETTPKFKF